MNASKRSLALCELFLVFPAALFFISLILRDSQPPPYQPGQAARQLVDWFASSPRLGLGVLLIAMPFAALVTGGFALLRSWRKDAQFRQAAFTAFTAIRPHIAALVISGATLLAAGMLAIVAAHMIAD